MMGIQFNRYAASAVATLLVVAVAGCGDSTGPDADLSEEEAAAVAEAVSQHVFSGTFSGLGSSAELGPEAPSLDLSPVPGGGAEATTTSFEFSGTCPEGGTREFAGEATVSDDGTELHIEASVTITDCSSTVDNRAVLITTTPSFDYTADFREISDTEFEWTSSTNGSFDFEVDGKTGSCSLNTETTLTGTETSLSGQITGSVCGRDVSESFEISST